jgi:hypothetical protein
MYFKKVREQKKKKRLLVPSQSLNYTTLRDEGAAETV